MYVFQYYGISAAIDHFFFFFLRFPLFFVPNFFELLLSSLHTPIVDYAERALIVNYGVESVYVDAAGKPAGTDISNSKKR